MLLIDEKKWLFILSFNVDTALAASLLTIVSHSLLLCLVCLSLFCRWEVPGSILSNITHFYFIFII